jgi:hypothetical protein
MLEIKTFTNKDQKIKALIFWDSWCWKTSFWWTAMKDFRTLFISAEGWLASIRKGQPNWWTHEVSDKDPEVLQITKAEQIKELRKPGVLEKLTQPYDVIIIDSLTEISDNLRRDLKWEKRFLDMQSWWVLADELKDVVIQIRDLNKHVIVICQEWYEKDKDWGIIKYIPNVDWSLKSKLSYYFDVVARITKLPGWERVVEINDSPLAPVKSRFACINDTTDMNLWTWIKLVVEDADAEEWEVVASVDESIVWKEMAQKVWFNNFDSAEKLFNSIGTMVWGEDEATQLNQLVSDIDKSWKFKWDQAKAVWEYIGLVVDYYHKQ